MSPFPALYSRATKFDEGRVASFRTRVELKIQWPQGRVGSSASAGTPSKMQIYEGNLIKMVSNPFRMVAHENAQIHHLVVNHLPTEKLGDDEARASSPGRRTSASQSRFLFWMNSEPLGDSVYRGL